MVRETRRGDTLAVFAGVAVRCRIGTTRKNSLKKSSGLEKSPIWAMRLAEEILRLGHDKFGIQGTNKFEIGVDVDESERHGES
ncbi:hypothetical protein VTN49DRAFT_7388 [Thermomyces lanuginosus]|uniref:uncharacterized protein n=1 Tax=Thermomyces lanuginosus TaxID=5541 RepID=UPI003742CFF7